jgi:hypothetical protein
MSDLELVRGLYKALLLKDMPLYHPDIDCVEWERDYSRLLEADPERGLWLYAVDLPEIMNCFLGYMETYSTGFDSSFSLDQYVSSTYPEGIYLMGKKSTSDRRPRFLHGLWSGVLEVDGVLKADPNSSCLMSLRQILLMVKKLKITCEEKDVEKAIDAFREIENNLPRSWKDTWDRDDPRWTPRFGHPLWGRPDEGVDSNDLFDSSSMHGLGFEPDWNGFRELCSRFCSQLGYLDTWSIRPTHGPGAVSDKERDFVKYDFRNWPEKLEAVFPYDWHASSDLSKPDYVTIREFPSRLIAVPKTLKGPRLIAAEPTAHQWIQGGIRRWLEERLKHSFLKDCSTMRTQVPSQELAHKSSLSRSHATIDLSSASDRLTTRLVEYVFQSNRTILDALHASRTRACQISDKELVLLKKFATQGSACTFPVQTIVYSLLSIWAVCLVRGFGPDEAYKASSQVQVFGDDIIVPTDCYGVATGLLESVGLVVSKSKSFCFSNFREACGMDAYKGVDITPAYVRQGYDPSPPSIESVVECSNNLHYAGYWHTADYLTRTIPENERKLLPVKALDGGYLGFGSFTGEDLSFLRSRYNNHLHFVEYRILTVDHKVVKRTGLGNGSLVQFFNEEPDPLLNYSSGQVSTVRSRKRAGWANL